MRQRPFVFSFGLIGWDFYPPPPHSLYHLHTHTLSLFLSLSLSLPPRFPLKRGSDAEKEDVEDLQMQKRPYKTSTEAKERKRKGKTKKWKDRLKWARFMMGRIILPKKRRHNNNNNNNHYNDIGNEDLTEKQKQWKHKEYPLHRPSHTALNRPHRPIEKLSLQHMQYTAKK